MVYQPPVRQVEGDGGGHEILANENRMRESG